MGKQKKSRKKADKEGRVIIAKVAVLLPPDRKLGDEDIITMTDGIERALQDALYPEAVGPYLEKAYKLAEEFSADRLTNEEPVVNKTADLTDHGGNDAVTAVVLTGGTAAVVSALSEVLSLL